MRSRNASGRAGTKGDFPLSSPSGIHIKGTQILMKEGERENGL